MLFTELFMSNSKVGQAVPDEEVDVTPIRHTMIDVPSI